MLRHYPHHMDRVRGNEDGDMSFILTVLLCIVYKRNVGLDFH